MKDLLYLVHRIPFPPRKGDKVRSYHFLKFLARSYRVHLATFIDDPADWNYRDNVRELCESTHFAPLHPIMGRILSLGALLNGGPLTVPYFWNEGLASWVNETIERHDIRRVLVFSSSMAQYVPDRLAREHHSVLDFVDVDSEKWSSYGEAHRGPIGALYRREGRRLLDYERDQAARFGTSVFVTREEAELFAARAPEYKDQVTWVGNGVDVSYFSPSSVNGAPYQGDSPTVVFTGAMDYKANVDAVVWFVGAVFPHVRAAFPDARFFIVGANPALAVRRLEQIHGVEVTGTVDDVRPYIAHADVAVAPLQVARGIQNKVLEAMALGTPIVCTSGAIQGISPGHGMEGLVADLPQDFAQRVNQVLESPRGDVALGSRAREFVCKHYDWSASAGRLGSLMEGGAGQAGRHRA